jgi:hypothetical protein
MPRRAALKQNSEIDNRYPPILIPACAEPRAPVRGVRLKAVATFTVAFAILCALAFIAGYTTR